MSTIAFTVPGDLVPWARALRGKHGATYNDPRVEAYKGTVRAYALAARQRAKRAGITWALDGLYQVQAVAFRSTAQRFDSDRALSTICDALVGVLYVDDQRKYVRSSQMWVGAVSKAHPRTVVIVRQCTEWDLDRVAEDLERTAARIGVGVA